MDDEKLLLSYMINSYCVKLRYYEMHIYIYIYHIIYYIIKLGLDAVVASSGFTKLQNFFKIFIFKKYI